MSECSSVETRELLPELLHDRLPAVERARVQEHVGACAACGSELELLRRVRAAATAVPTIDVSRVAAAIPGHRARPAWVRVVQMPAFRIAAAIALIAGSIWLFQGPADVAPVIPPSVIAELPSTSAVAATSHTELPIGDALGELTEGDLHALIDELDELDAVTPAEADVDFPSIRGSE
jgi:hypothetical protein